MSGTPFICKDEMPLKCQEISFNTTEEVVGIQNPDPDIWNYLKRGAITKEFNKGLRNPQAKLMTVDTYNGGCVDGWGCVANTGFKCGENKAQTSAINNMYDFLQSPLLTGVYKADLEYKPPPYMQGIKAGTANSVTGWDKTVGGQYVWADLNRQENPRVAAAFAETKCK